MPFAIPTARDKFKWQLDGESPGGLPLANIIQLGNAAWIEVCPICSCIHELPASAQPGDMFKPVCLLKTLHPSVYQNWLKRFPDARNYTRVTLSARDEIRLLTPALPAPAKRQKKAA